MSTTLTRRILTHEEGDARWYMGHLFDWKVRSENSDGRVSVVEVLCYRGGEPPVHVHAHEDEVFYVLEGSVEFMVGDERRSVGPGGCVWAPRDVPHGFAFLTEEVRMLIMLTPGSEAAFDAASVPAQARTAQPPPLPEYDLARVEALDAEAGVTYLGPPLSQR